MRIILALLQDKENETQLFMFAVPYPIVAYLGHPFLTLRCPFDNSVEKREATLPIRVSVHTQWRCWEEMYTPLRAFVPATLLVNDLETRAMGGLDYKTYQEWSL